MKKKLSAVILVFLMAVGVAAQTTVNNPATPKHPNPNRVYKLKKLKTINDDGENFYFKNPGNMSLDAAGNLYIVDEHQLLKFDTSGKFVRNFWKLGLGPGEIKRLGKYVVPAHDQILLKDLTPNKYLLLSQDGRVLVEKRINRPDFLYLLHKDPQNLFFYYKDVRANTKGFVIMNISNQIVAYSEKHGSIRPIFSLPTKHAVIVVNNRPLYISYTDLLYHQLKDNLFYFANTDDYRVKLIDIGTGKTLLSLSREYKHVPVTEELKAYLAHVEFNNDAIHYSSPYPDYMNDIQYLTVVNGKLLVFTSTVEKNKGVLVDVFDEKGVFVDSFFLDISTGEVLNQLNMGWLCLNGKVLYALDRDEDYNWVISNYSFEDVAKDLK